MYKVFFDDETIFDGGHYTNSKWNEMPNKTIKKLEYTLFNKTIILKGFESYNHIVEHSYLSKTGSKKILKVILMGKVDQKVYQFIYDFEKHCVLSKIKNFGQEFRMKKTTGWKKGELNNPKMKFKET